MNDNNPDSPPCGAVVQVCLLQEQPSHHGAHPQQQRGAGKSQPDGQERHRQAEQAVQVL